MVPVYQIFKILLDNVSHILEAMYQRNCWLFVLTLGELIDQNRKNEKGEEKE